VKNVLILSLFVFASLFAAPARAQDGYFVANTQILVGDDIVSGEYAWAEGDFSGYGFADVAVHDDFHITDHEVRYHVANPVFLSAELGYNRFGGTTFKVGVGASLGDVPFVKENFVFLNVYAQEVVSGPGGDHLFGLAFETKSIALTESISIYAAGFADFKAGAPDVIQPQVWMKFNDSPIEIGTEVAIFGDETSVSGALKYKF